MRWCAITACRSGRRIGSSRVSCRLTSAGCLVRDHAEKGEGEGAPRPLSEHLAEVSAEVLGSPLKYSETALAEILSPTHFVRVRKTPGGPAPEETAQAVSLSLAELEADRSWWTNTTRILADAEHRLAVRAASL